ncbi:MAG: ATP-binding cassette domain-containing protein [Halobacteria archaeon]
MIRVKDLKVHRGGGEVLSSISTEFRRGSFRGLIGPNGVGKTTLLRSIAATLEPRCGNVVVNGRDINSLPSGEASQLVSVVPQQTHLSFDFDVKSVVEMGRTPYRDRLTGQSPRDRSAVESAMERTSVKPLSARSVGRLSGGERQRVLIARALAQQTPVMILDEPTANLDIKHQARTIEMTRELVDEGKTVVAAVHDLNLAAEYCDEIKLMSHDGIIDSGAPAEVLVPGNIESAFGTEAVVSRHPVTGSVDVRAVNRENSKKDTSVHVVPGSRGCSELLYSLYNEGLEVSVGAVSEGSTVHEAAKALGMDAVTVAPFSGIDAEKEASVKGKVVESDLTVVFDVEPRGGNLPNLKAASKADKLVTVEENPCKPPEVNGVRSVQEVYESLRSPSEPIEFGNVAEDIISCIE